MTIEIFNYAQGTPEWFAARCGIPTASEFHSIMSKGRGGKPSATRRAYMIRLAAEIISGKTGESFSTVHTRRGHEMEGTARDWYAMHYDADPVEVGFIRNGRKGYSPDLLVGERGLLEIKSKLPELWATVVDGEDFPADHIAQCQGGLWVAEREWIDIVVWWDGLPAFVKRAHRDEVYIANLSREVAEFTAELDETVAAIRAYQLPVLDMAA